MITTDMVRGVIIGLSEGGEKEVSHALIYNALGLDSDDERACCRARIGHLIQKRELERVRPGVFLHKRVSHGRTGESFIRMWRGIRAQTGSFETTNIMQISHVTGGTAGRYIKFLLEEEYIRFAGKKGNIKLYTVTGKGRNRRETPYPPLPIKDPFAVEREAMSRLARIFFEKDLYVPANAERIVKECGLILSRFTKDENLSSAEDGVCTEGETEN